MAKKYVLESFLQNANEIRVFYEKEIKGRPEQESSKGKAERKDIYALDEYADLINTYRGKGKKITNQSIEDLVEANKKVNTKNIFTKGAEGQKLKWVNNEYSRKAMEKFTQMIMKNDLKKFQYCQTYMKNNRYGNMQAKGVLESPVPMVREATLEDGEKLKYNIDRLLEGLNKAKGFRHEDSAEFKKMKEVLMKMKETMSSEYNKEEIGEQLEELQEASMNYIRAKGVGKQISGMGKTRMALALSICNLSSDFMDVYASSKRMEQIKLMEKTYLGHEAMSKNGVLAYRKDNLGRYKASALEKEEKVVEQDEMVF